MDRKTKILTNFGYVQLDTGKWDFIKIKDIEHIAHCQNSMKYDKSKAINERTLEKVKRQKENNPDSNNFSNTNAQYKSITALYRRIFIY